MIYTITFNPSLDYIVELGDLKVGGMNRAGNERIIPGGKGLNVSMILRNLGYDSVALGFLAGFTGNEIARLLRDKGFTTDFVYLRSGYNRINVKLYTGQETEINGGGPVISNMAFKQLEKKLDMVRENDYVVLAGAIPPTMTQTAYRDVVAYLYDRNLKFVIDASNDLLKNVLAYKPFLVKPNRRELGEMFGVEIEGHEDALRYARELKKLGAENVIASLGHEGAVMITQDNEEIVAKAPIGKVINSVGSGDSMVGGFLAGYLNTGSYRSAFKYAICTGSATAFTKDFATRRQVDALMALYELKE